MKKLLTLITFVMVALLVSCGKIGGDSDQQENEDKTEQTDGQSNKNTDNTNDSSADNVKSQDKSAEQKLDSADIANQIGNLRSDVDSLQSQTKTLSEAVDNCYFCKYGIVAYIVYAIAIIVLFLILRIIWIIATAKSPEAKKEEAAKKNQLKARLNALELAFSNLKADLDRMGIKVQNINNDVKSIGDNVVYAGTRISDDTSSRASQPSQPVQTPRNNPTNPPASKQKSTVFYLKFPGTDGNFDYAPVSKAEGYYRFVLDSRNSNTARFYFEPGDPTAMARAINNRTYYIEMACEPVTAPDGMVTSCRGEGNSYGEAKLENGKWIVKSKQKVRYE